MKVLLTVGLVGLLLLVACGETSTPLEEEVQIVEKTVVEEVEPVEEEVQPDEIEDDLHLDDIFDDGGVAPPQLPN